MDTAPERPEYGDPCNGCGACCAAERCHIAVRAIGAGPGPCPLMEFKDGRFWCQVVLAEEQMGVIPVVRKSLGIGKGCVSELPKE